MKFKIGSAEVEINPWLAVVFLLFLLLAVIAESNVLLVYPVLFVGGGMIIVAGFVYMLLMNLKG